MPLLTPTAVTIIYKNAYHRCVDSSPRSVMVILFLIKSSINALLSQLLVGLEACYVRCLTVIIAWRRYGS